MHPFLHIFRHRDRSAVLDDLSLQPEFDKHPFFALLPMIQSHQRGIRKIRGAREISLLKKICSVIICTIFEMKQNPFDPTDTIVGGSFRDFAAAAALAVRFLGKADVTTNDRSALPIALAVFDAMGKGFDLVSKMKKYCPSFSPDPAKRRALVAKVTETLGPLENIAHVDHAIDYAFSVDRHLFSRTSYEDRAFTDTQFYVVHPLFVHSRSAFHSMQYEQMSIAFERVTALNLALLQSLARGCTLDPLTLVVGALCVVDKRLRMATDHADVAHCIEFVERNADATTRATEGISELHISIFSAEIAAARDMLAKESSHSYPEFGRSGDLVSLLRYDREEWLDADGGASVDTMRFSGNKRTMERTDAASRISETTYSVGPAISSSGLEKRDARWETSPSRSEEQPRYERKRTYAHIPVGSAEHRMRARK
jgi:hypothetical protein